MEPSPDFCVIMDNTSYYYHNIVRQERTVGEACEKNGKAEKSMKIYVDADACPVVAQIEKIAGQYEVETILLCDTNHVLNSDYSQVCIIGAGADAVDFALINKCRRGDVVISQDYGVAAMALGKGAYCIHQSGRWYTNENIDQLLMERHMAKEARRASSKNHSKGPRKRTPEDDKRFAESFEKMIRMALDIPRE